MRRYIPAAIVAALALALAGLVPRQASSSPSSSPQGGIRFLLAVPMAPQQADLHNLPAPMAAQQLVEVTGRMRVIPAPSHGECYYDAVIVTCDGATLAMITTDDAELLKLYENMWVSVKGTTRTCERIQLVDVSGVPVLAKDPCPVDDDPCPPQPTQTKLPPQEHPSPTPASTRPTATDQPAPTAVPTEPPATRVPPTPGSDLPTATPATVPCGDEVYRTALFALLRKHMGNNPAEWTDAVVKSKWRNILEDLGVTGTMTWRSDEHPTTIVRYPLLDPVSGETLMVPAGLAELNVDKFKSGEAFVTDDLWDPNAPSKLWVVNGKCLAIDRGERGSRVWTGSQKCRDVVDLTSDQTTVFFGDPSCQWSVWDRFGQCPITVAAMLALAGRDSASGSDTFTLLEDPQDGPGVDGVQLAPKSQVESANCVDAIHVNGQPVPRLPANTMGSIWLRSDTRPMRVR